MHRKREESLSQFEVALETGKFRLPAEWGLERLTLEKTISLFFDLWYILTDRGREIAWLSIYEAADFDIQRTAKALRISISAVRQRITRLKKALKLAQPRKTPMKNT
jgi:hypothetical protein